MSLRINGWSNRATFFLERFYDLPTQLLLKQTLQSGDLFVDVGANEGMMSLLGSRLVGYTGRVIAFEPNETPRGIFQANVARNGITNIDIKAAGLGEKSGMLDLFVPSINTGEGTFTPTGRSDGVRIKCPVVVGDDVLDGEKPRLIKIDVEGFELNVLRGLKKTLVEKRPIVVMEMIEEHLARASTSPQELISFLAELGYSGRRIDLQGRRTLAFRDIPSPWVDGDYVWTFEG
jgi:FkbM family methyltransferase